MYLNSDAMTQIFTCKIDAKLFNLLALEIDHEMIIMRYISSIFPLKCYYWYVSYAKFEKQ